MVRAKAERGERVATRAPYGYMKDPNNPKQIIINPDTAPIVEKIFKLCVEGSGPMQIAKQLTKEKIYTALGYDYVTLGKAPSNWDKTKLYDWCSESVMAILENIAYLGHTLNCKYTTLSYKNKKRIERPKSEQLLFKNTHEPIIDQDTFDTVQRIRANKRRRTNMDEQNKYSGLVACADCGSNMVLHRAKTMTKEQNNFMCGLYKKKGKDVCPAHFIREEVLEQIILEDIRRVTLFARNREKEFAKTIRASSNDEAKQKLSLAQKELDRQLKRQNEVNTIFKRLYEDNVIGKVTNEQFRSLSADYTAEQAQLAESIPILETQIESLKNTALDIDRFITKAKKFADITELTPEILHTFVKKIVVHERSEKYSRTATQKIEIHYTHVGELQIKFDNVDYITKDTLHAEEKQTA